MAKKFHPVTAQTDFVQMENDLLHHWYKSGVVEKYLHKNDESKDQFSFLDGPITANNPMGVHHAWGRTYKDLWQRYNTMLGKKQRYQNGFDEQGLWVEVEVEKELGLKDKKEIENLVPGDKTASIAKFVNLCKERVKKYSGIQTDQSKRLGYFMDWEHSYHTSSDKNNYTIWNFLKVVNEKGWLYKGHDSVPWCPRCGTAISQHEIATEEYKELTHESIYFNLKVRNQEFGSRNHENEYLLAWTTTPWTIPGNVAIAVNPDETYVAYPVGDDKVWVMEKALSRLVAKKILPPTTTQNEAERSEASLAAEKPSKSKDSSVTRNDKLEFAKGIDLVGLTYDAPFDDLERVKGSLDNYQHRVVAGDDQILPVSAEEGTGLVHVAPGAGSEDFKLGKKENLPVIELIDEEATYIDGFGELSGQNAKVKPGIIINQLKTIADGKFLLTTQSYTHRYPTCWRCKTELVWRVVDEWYIAMDKPALSVNRQASSKEIPSPLTVDASPLSYREQMMDMAKKIDWHPKWGKERELDWLKNMHDWLISKKRFWGLALPIWECKDCNRFEVIGSYDELKERAVAGWEDFEGHSPHRPWVDAVKIACQNCGSDMSRIPDVGNPWLDAGIVPFSTLPQGWFPADFITESFPGQFKNWFYAMIAMSTALTRENPFKSILGFASVVDEKGEEMHKSKGNAIAFDQAADEVGVDPMRWLYARQNPEQNLKFGYNVIAEVRRRFYLILWNSYKYFIDYANLAGFECIDFSQQEDGSSNLESGISESVMQNDAQHSEASAETGGTTESKDPSAALRSAQGDKVNQNPKLTVLDKWILARLTEVVQLTNERLQHFDAATPARTIEDFVINDYSTWYIRRSRDRVGPNADKTDEMVCLNVMYGVLVTLSKLIAPFMPFVTDEMYKNLTGYESVHLANYPLGDKSLLNDELVANMAKARQIVEMGHAIRKTDGIKLRQPLASVTYATDKQLPSDIEEIIADELNVKSVKYQKADKQIDVKLDENLTDALKAEGEAREIIRQIQQARKEAKMALADEIIVSLPEWPHAFEADIKKQTLAKAIKHADTFLIEKA